ncbi:MAG: T9SS type A sorting domain-containing protein [Chitinophagales bacterium]|nr:T9SS type A sorting domain-containing protein [Chitinophagales bacterium]
MKHTTTLILTLLLSGTLSAQGICDSVISIAPIPPICQGTGLDYLETSHPWGDFTGPGVNPGSPYLDAENLNPGVYTITYTITGPGGCTVQATRDFEVLPAFEMNTWVQGKIDCSNPNSQVMVMAFLTPDPNGVQYQWPSWEGPEGQSFFNQSFQASYAGRYKMMAFPSNGQGCPAYAFAEVGFQNNPLQINIVSCSDCNAPGGTRIKLDTIPAGWGNPRYSLQVGFFDNSQCRELMEPGMLKATLTNPDNGCVSEATRFFSSLTKTPSVSAGSDVGLWCGGTPNLLAATEPKNNDNTYSFFWERPNGTTFPASWGSTLPVSEPGAYVLRGLNLFTGCQTSDVANVSPAPPLVGTEIKVLCDGESYLGHNQTGNYTDTITLPNGCEKIQFTKIIVLAPLVAEADITPDNGSGNGSIDLEITQGWPFFSYNWTTSETTQDIANLQAGTYEVSITDGNNCIHVREFLVPSGKPSPKSGSRLNQLQAVMYPNPSTIQTGQLQILIRSSQEDQGNLVLLDGLGRMVRQSPVSLQVGENTINLEGALPAGMYYCVWQNSAGAEVLDKLVVVEFIHR